MKSYACILSLLLASTAMAAVTGDTYNFSTAQTGSVTISPLGAGGSFTAPAGPGFCVGPNGNNCVSSGMFGAISFNSNQIIFNFSGSTFSTGGGTFVLNLTGFVPANILNVTYNSGSLLNGTFGLTSFSSSSMVFTGSIGEGFFNAINGRTIVFDVVTGVPPSITKSFSPNQIIPGGTSTLTLKITNNNAAVAISGVAFTDTYPAGLVTASPSNLTSTCGGATVATASSVSLSGGSIAAGATCTITVSVAGVTEGIKNNSVTVTSNFGTGNTASATLTVATPPSLTKSFGTILTLLPGGTTGLAFTLTNPNSAVTLTGLAFSDTLPPGLLVSNPSVVTGSCDGGTITAVAGSNLITLTGATLASGASCAFSVNVTAAGSEIGQVTNTTSTVTSNQALPGAAASASIFIGNAFEVRYASNLGIGDSVVNVTNSGTSSTNAFPTQNGNLCVNVYTFSPDEQLISCCTCPVTPDGLDSLSARNDLISNTLTPGVPTSIVTKVLASTGPVCNASTVGLGGNVLATGLAAWGTTIHALPVTAGSPATTYGSTETPFTPSTLSIAELTRITTLCGFIQTNGSGFGICKSCRFGGLAASQQ